MKQPPPGSPVPALRLGGNALVLSNRNEYLSPC